MTFDFAIKGVSEYILKLTLHSKALYGKTSILGGRGALFPFSEPAEGGASLV